MARDPLFDGIPLDTRSTRGAQADLPLGAPAWESLPAPKAEAVTGPLFEAMPPGGVDHLTPGVIACLAIGDPSNSGPLGIPMSHPAPCARCSKTIAAGRPAWLRMGRPYHGACAEEVDHGR